MTTPIFARRPRLRSTVLLPLAALASAACAHKPASMDMGAMAPSGGMAMSTMAAPSPDPRVGLRGGMWDAASANWNMRLVSTTRPSEQFVNGINSDLAFTGPYVIQGSFNGYQVWDLTDPTHPSLKGAEFCPASQSDVSTYRNLLFVSSEGTSARLDCGKQGVKEPVSNARLRGLRIFDITDIANPKYVGNVQTCRGSHTHTLLVDPKDADNVYVYISGSAGVRPADELAGCSEAAPAADPSSALFRIEVIKVPLAHPEQAAIVSSPRIFNDLVAPAVHGPSEADRANNAKVLAEAKARGAFTANIHGEEQPAPSPFIDPMLDSIVGARKGTGKPTAADSAALRAALPRIVAHMLGEDGPAGTGPKPGPTQCHDITVYPAIGLAGGACEGYGLLLDIRDPAHPVRLTAASDSNFSYWHSATFNNDGTKVLFSDEWGGGMAPKCRASDKKEWGADAIFTVNGGRLQFQSYYKMPAAQTSQENCVAHNGSLIPVPGRDVMVQAWYQGGVSVFDWTDAAHPAEIAYFDRGPIDSTHSVLGGTWSVYWYNGNIVSSEIVRGLDVFALTPSAMMTQNEIDAAKSVHLDYLNTQGQPHFVWPASFALSRAYADQLARSGGLSKGALEDVREALGKAEQKMGGDRKEGLTKLASKLDGDAGTSSDAGKVRMLAKSVRDLAGM